MEFGEQVMPEYCICTVDYNGHRVDRKISSAWTIKKPSNRRCEL